MLRLVGSTAIGALLAAPIGFADSMPAVLAGTARLIFLLLALSSIVFMALGAFWSRRWPV